MLTSQMNIDEVREVHRAFAATYLKRNPRLHSVGIRNAPEGGFCLVASGTPKALAGLPREYQGIRVVGRKAGPARVALAGKF